MSPWGESWATAWAEAAWAERADVPPDPEPEVPAPVIANSGGGFGVRMTIPYYEQVRQKPPVARRAGVEEDEALLLAVL